MAETNDEFAPPAPFAEPPPFRQFSKRQDSLGYDFARPNGGSFALLRQKVGQPIKIMTRGWRQPDGA